MFPILAMLSDLFFRVTSLQDIPEGEGETLFSLVVRFLPVLDLFCRIPLYY
jgi:hypothetical protein